MGKIKLTDIIAVVTLVVNLSSFIHCDADIKVYEFTLHANLSYPGKRLVGHVFEEFSTKRQVIHCAYECLKSSRCKSFNYEAGGPVCQLNEADHEEFEDSLVAEEDGHSTDYHHRNAFSIDQEALGFCAQDPCQNGARCLDTMNAKMKRTYFCFCADGFTGTNCERPMNSLDWGEWEDWAPCSVSCETGYTTRWRRCMDLVTSKPVSSSKCFGRDVEYKTCLKQPCPRWEFWQEWGPCSTESTCGRGVKHRHRECANGGVPGVDRYCLGFTNETGTCMGINCRGMLLIKDKGLHGEGRIEITNDINDTRMSICADDHWGVTEIDIACKQIGFEGAYINPGLAQMNEGSNITYVELMTFNATVTEVALPIQTVECDGTEKTLQQCRRRDAANCSLLGGIQCRVRGGWSLWGAWSDCDVTCENGTRTRTRDCNHPPPNFGGMPCRGDETQFKHCELPMCPSNGTWGGWGAWTGCDVTCGNGVLTRYRECESSTLPCIGTNVTHDICITTPCAVDGVWELWSTWSECDVTCENGTRFRTRTCTGPFYGGAECPGPEDEVEGCFPKMCPVDGVWTTWVSWTECTHTCGYGSRNRSRQCDGPYHAGLPCPGEAGEIEPCNTFSCPVDGSWKLWTEWDECSTTCGGGLRNRTRECNNPLHGGEGCTGPSMESENCNEHNCPIDGVFTDWSTWSECSVTCANGTMYRERTCFGPYFGGNNCSGSYDEEAICVTDECPVDGVWGDWMVWQSCDRTCGGGKQLRVRICEGVLFGGIECEGDQQQLRDCNIHACPVDGVWDMWQSWNSCNVSCGGGTMLRVRSCEGPYYGGNPCNGSSEDRMECNTHECPIDGEWDEWMSWSVCNASCEGGYQFRKRICDGPNHGGMNCTGEVMEWETCNEEECPVGAFWEAWQEWGECDASCAGGTSIRVRICNPADNLCEGNNQENRTCNEQECPVDGIWEVWSNWTECTVTCNTGSQERQRVCSGPFHGGADCVGDHNQTRDCNTDRCPIDGIYSEWTTWSTCSQSCGRGETYRNRTCFGPYFDGAPCDGVSEETKYCNPSSCPVHGIWNPWTTWTDCSTTCENGTRTRNRTCDGPYDGGDPCEGPFDEIEDCFLRMCPIDGVFEPWTDWDECPVTCGGGIQNRTRVCEGPYHGGANCTGPLEESQECNPYPCPVDGSWSLWSKWSNCNSTCGGGYSMRTRYCSENMHGGSDCSGDGEQYQDCNMHECPIDGVWNPWGNWTECTHTCGTGEKTRFRECDGPYFDGAECDGPTNETENCNTHECPIDGNWGSWKIWSKCTKPCGGGQQLRVRVCLGAHNGGHDCIGNPQEQRTCNVQSCPVDGVWDDWQTWSTCNTTCGGGTRWRYRECIGPFYGGAECPDRNISMEDCNTHECPIDGVWNDWTDWELCSVTCGGGNQSRYRDCDGPFFGGANCSGPWDETRECNTHNCPIDGYLSDWSEFYQCDVTCGGGIQWRNRTCIGPFFGGANCSEELLDSRDCNTHNCPIDGEWISWSPWEQCDVTCGTGIQWRNRTCDGPYYGGAECDGPDMNNRTCNDFPCPVDGVWMLWSTWGDCPVTCGGGIHSRNRTCDGPYHGGADCPGPAIERQDCNTHNCPVDGVFEEWSGWGECDVTCGGGIQWRNRSCEGPFYGGADCEGPLDDSQSCNTQECPIDGSWKPWESWGECSVTCGGGIRVRERICHGPFFGGAECDGSFNDTEHCALELCPVPGDWNQWSNWTLCSVTCGGGTRFRNRTCDMESYGNLTAPCEGDAEDYEDCHSFECLPLAIHCSDWATRGLNQSCIADVDPDGEGNVFDAVEVECDFDSEPGTALTIIHHDHENRTRVKGYEGAGEYQIILDYFIGWGEAIQIVDSSAECKQYLSWECYAAIIHNPFNPDMLTTFWMNRTSQMTNYFGGATPGSGNCRCGETNSCYNNSLPCNCDENDEVWRIDDGFVTNKVELPIHSFYAGDTGGTKEDGYKFLGPVICAGMDASLNKK